MFLSSYWLQMVLCWAVAAFATATIVVAVQRAQMEADLRDVLEKIDIYGALGEGRARSRLLRDTAAQQLEEEVIDYRLPTDLVPNHYKLYWHPELETGNFTGQLEITVHVASATQQIVLHAHKLSISGIYVQGETNGQKYEVDNSELDTVREFFIINLAEPLPVDVTIIVGLLFEGVMRGKLVGLYSSTYQNPAGEERTIATSKFEPTYAREAFPCFDEPAMKATYEITVVHPSGSYHALSNMNQLESEYLGEYTQVTFNTSVPMSSYLACIIVSDFDYESKTVNASGIGSDFTMRAYATSHKLDRVTFALNFGVAVTEYYIQYYKVAYPLPKLDMAAIPDFASNAMEHWGLVTYRETALLYDESYSSTSDKQSIAGTLAHEIAHMWFGNLVTMKWWNDIWLNEGFARYMQYKGVNAVYPEWGMLEQFQIIALHPVLDFDAKLSSHPIVQNAESPAQITALFDTISYEKGGSIIRMLENVVGAENFEQAVTNYLNKWAFQNTVTADFLAEIAALVGDDVNVELLMRTWTQQMGYPVLNVERSDAGFTITQKRFLSNQASYEEVTDASEFNYTWSIPITYILDNDEVNGFIFHYTDDKVDIAVPAEVKWLKLNVHQVGFYRVNYDEETWQLLIAELLNNPSSLAIADRANLLNDAFALADAAQLPYKVALDMTAYLAEESDFVPWYVASEILKNLQRSLMYSESYVQYLEYARELLKNVYEEVGWIVDSDNHLKNRLRVSVLSAACSVGLPDCLEKAAQLLETWLENPTAANKPAPDLRQTVYYYGMQQLSSESIWEQLLEHSLTEQDAAEKVKLMYGLSGVQDAQLLYRFVELAANEHNVRSQDYFACLGNIAANPIGEAIVWEYYREHWLDLVERFGVNDRQLGRLIATITSNFASEVKLEEVQQFYDKHPEAGAGTSPRKQALENIKYNIEWLQQNSGDILNWLNGSPTPL